MACADFSRPGPCVSGFEFILRDQCHEIRHDHWLISEASQAVGSHLYSCFLVTETHLRIVSRMLSDLPSKIQQEIEYIRPMVEERFAKMEEYEDDWDDKPVCQTFKSGMSLITQLIHRTICSCG